MLTYSMAHFETKFLPGASGGDRSGSPCVDLLPLSLGRGKWQLTRFVQNCSSLMPDGAQLVVANHSSALRKMDCSTWFPLFECCITRTRDCGFAFGIPPKCLNSLGLSSRAATDKCLHRPPLPLCIGSIPPLL